MEENKILLVEDDPDIAALTSLHLKKSGFQVTIAVDGEMATTEINSGRPIDLVLMDIDLGMGMDGFETAREIEKSSNQPIIFHSSHTEADFISRARQISKFGYVIKGNSRFILVDSVRLALDTFELYQLYRLKRDAYMTDGIRHRADREGGIICAICDMDKKYTWINYPHPDFHTAVVLGKNDLEIAENEGTRALFELKAETLLTGQELSADIEFPMQEGTLVYEVRSYPLKREVDDFIYGVKTVSILK